MPHNTSTDINSFYFANEKRVTAKLIKELATYFVQAPLQLPVLLTEPDYR